MEKLNKIKLKRLVTCDGVDYRKVWLHIGESAIMPGFWCISFYGEPATFGGERILYVNFISGSNIARFELENPGEEVLRRMKELNQ